MKEKLETNKEIFNKFVTKNGAILKYFKKDNDGIWQLADEIITFENGLKKMEEISNKSNFLFWINSDKGMKWLKSDQGDEFLKHFFSRMWNLSNNINMANC